MVPRIPDGPYRMSNLCNKFSWSVAESFPPTASKSTEKGQQEEAGRKGHRHKTYQASYLMETLLR